MTAVLAPKAVTRHAFAHIETWVFDLDNTLYPAGTDLWPKIDARITLFLAHLYGLDGISARELQKFYYERYGTTLRGLMVDHAIEPDAFLSFVHDIDRTSILPNPVLAAAIAALPGRRLILTNGSRHHALSTASALGLDGLFEDIFDIVAGDLLPKPEAETYHRFLARHAVDPTRAVMFEDIARNLLVPKALGMTTVLVVPKPGAMDDREAFEIVSEITPEHVDFVTSDLEGFLQAIAPV
ncbi:pyrimidine 5'-nucleotidase [Beijerinckia sp. L45]|uniref:pyrimidine 5'-nucleotidase n=1 Tax=Beijerinckia sp. L45 TaxID=1641855 RepID=UPI00131BAFC7|nr:pyrimidine 5'-nucleotidase [Beijerinckia sp. L45]